MAETDEVVSKGDFAKLCGVSPGRVTQWIDEGKISGDALVGEGRAARIKVDIASRQVALRRDIGQALGNGATTKLAASRAAVRIHEDCDGGDPTDPTTTDDLDRKLKANKLEAAERANRLAATEELALRGFYTETATARVELGKVAGQMLRLFEGALPDIAAALAAAFHLDTREVTLHLNEQFRKLRERTAEVSAAAAQALPDTLDPDAA